jgi:1,4-alpha-glucan branching enzyme
MVKPVIHVPKGDGEENSTMAGPLGCFVMVLHAHIPFVLGHGTWPHGSEMLHEAAADSYIPLLWSLEELVNEGISPRLVISISPITMEQLDDNRFKTWFEGYLDERIRLAHRDIERFHASGEGHLHYLAHRWRERYEGIRESFLHRYGRDIIGQFRRFQDAGHIEVMTTAATHGYLPLLHEDGSIQLQIKAGIACYEKYFGRRPRAFWLPECAYRPKCLWAASPAVRGQEIPYPRKGIEEFLAENGIDYFMAESHMLSGGSPEPVDIDRENTLGKLWGGIRKTREPRPFPGEKTPCDPYFVGHYYEDHPPVAVLVRDASTSLKIWSSDHGFPGDPDYLDFHRKDSPDGMRYWRVTGRQSPPENKWLYEPSWAQGKVRQHAGHFLWSAKESLRLCHRPHGSLPVICAPFDAELFGHWWHEGPSFLTVLLRWMHSDPEIMVCTGSEYLANNPPETAITLPEGSWGAGGGNSMWLNEDTLWTWDRVYDAELDFKALIRDHGPGHDETMRALLHQAMRELLLLQSSDWQFLISTWSARDYAERRILCHHSDFKKVVETARTYARGEWVVKEDWDYMRTLQQQDFPFSILDPAWYAEIVNPA